MAKRKYNPVVRKSLVNLCGKQAKILRSMRIAAHQLFQQSGPSLLEHERKFFEDTLKALRAAHGHVDCLGNAIEHNTRGILDSN